MIWFLGIKLMMWFAALIPSCCGLGTILRLHDPVCAGCKTSHILMVLHANMQTSCFFRPLLSHKWQAPNRVATYLSVAASPSSVEVNISPLRYLLWRCFNHIHTNLINLFVQHRSLLPLRKPSKGEAVFTFLALSDFHATSGHSLQQFNYSS
jgi:hypothetical protein